MYVQRGIYVPVDWQIYARHGKASGRTFFPTNQQLFLRNSLTE